MFQKNLRLQEGNVLDPNEPNINTSQTKLRNVCLSVILEFCLMSLSLSVPGLKLSNLLGLRAKSLKSLLEIPYVILDYPNAARFLIFENVSQIVTNRKPPLPILRSAKSGSLSIYF